ncbi:hypothetical protein PAECIP111893_00384 [Paenibacillus plantiphilus]|uniref:Uncharacterized protein n=1 Tax=Paenibacillus plantiphilus TaxID=2905650 RepID=A0ABN8G1M0_9BACL|nr:hypothetical protein [Paenibacillus plantiphilus]CAH1193097.1 hypothetical protein PAECIP111893_00384 [Paenibacillus plantiphilus]
MKQKWIKYGVITLTASSLLLQGGILSSLPISAAASKTTKATLSSSIVKLNGSSYLNIRDAHFLMQEKGKVLAFSVAITNNGSNQLDLLDYWLRVKTKSGKSFKSTVLEADKAKTTVAAKSTQYITYYAVVDNATKISDLAFEVVKWDFSAANYERRLGLIKYPANTTDVTPAFKDTVMLINNGKLRGAIKQTSITKDANSAYLTINFLMENVGLQTTDLTKLNFFLQTESLSVYNATVSGLEQTTIQPKERKIVTLHATIPISVAGKTLSFITAQNDETSKVQLPSGVFALPATKVSTAVPIGQTRMVYMSGMPIDTKTGQVFLTQGSDKNQIALDYKMTNIGTTAIVNPNLDYYILTSTGTSYPLTYTKEENGSLLPNIEKTVSLTGEIPTSIKPDTAQLLVKTTASEKEKSYIIGTYNIQTTSQEGGLGSSFKHNDYRVKLNSIERSPMEENDVLVANITITNNSDISKKVPAMGGYFMINGVKVGTEQQATALDDSITIAPGASYDMVVYSPIPYTTIIDKITFVSTEPVQDKPGKMLYQFSGQQLTTLPLKSTDAPYEITIIGKKASIKILRSAIFEGKVKNNYYVEFEAVNNENRSALIASLGGYIKDNIGNVVPLKFAEVKEKVSPNGKILISAWAQIGKSFDSTNYSLTFGQTIGTTKADGGTGNGSDNANAGNDKTAVIIKPVSYALKGDANTGTKTDFKDIEFAGYKLNLSKIFTTLNVQGLYTVDGIKMTLNYNLNKNAEYDYVAGEHKLLFEFINNDTAKTTYSKQYGITAASENEDTLKETNDSTLTFTISDPEIQNKVQKYDDYTLNVYDVFQNTKLLIATKTLKWNTTSE